MRRTLRLLANVKPGRYLDPGAPTGLTGLFVHSSPRSTLLYVYSSTLDKLQAIPEHSLYRQSVEALTKHRMSLVESVVPAGYPEWAEKAAKIISSHPEQFNVTNASRVNGANATRVEKNGQVFLIRHLPEEMDMREQEWDGEINEGPELEGPRSAEERQEQEVMANRKDLTDVEQTEWTPEPQWTADQYVVALITPASALVDRVTNVPIGSRRSKARSVLA